jgi:hypothetical protein
VEILDQILRDGEWLRTVEVPALAAGYVARAGATP